MRCVTLVGMVLAGLVFSSAGFALACGHGGGQSCLCCGRCMPQCGCVPCYCVPVDCLPAGCEPACCEPAAGVTQAVPAQRTVTPLPSEARAPVAKPAEEPVSVPPSAADAPARSPAASAPPVAPRAAGRELPTKSPAVPAGSEVKPAERPAKSPTNEPLVAEGDGASVLETDEMQIWTDSTGNFRIEARFVSFDGRTVRLQRPSGRYVRIDFDRLSVADRQRVRDLSLVLAMKTAMK